MTTTPATIAIRTHWQITNGSTDSTDTNTPIPGMMLTFTHGHKNSHALIWKTYRLHSILLNCDAPNAYLANTIKLIAFKTNQEADAAAAVIKTLPLVANPTKLVGLSCIENPSAPY